MRRVNSDPKIASCASEYAATLLAIVGRVRSHPSRPPEQPASGRAQVSFRVGRLASGHKGRISHARFGLFCHCNCLAAHDRQQAVFDRQLHPFAEHCLVSILEDLALLLRMVPIDCVEAKVLKPAKAGDDFAPVSRRDAELSLSN